MSQNKPALCAKHPFYCNDFNCYTPTAAQEFATVDEFLKKYKNTSTDLDLCFRFDVKPFSESCDNKIGPYYAEIFIMRQRQGLFRPIVICNYTAADDEKMKAWLEPHWKKLKEMWKPFSD
jgi:hypothetical protein